MKEDLTDNSWKRSFNLYKILHYSWEGMPINTYPAIEISGPKFGYLHSHTLSKSFTIAILDSVHTGTLYRRQVYHDSQKEFTLKEHCSFIAKMLGDDLIELRNCVVVN